MQEFRISMVNAIHDPEERKIRLSRLYDLLTQPVVSKFETATNDDTRQVEHSLMAEDAPAEPEQTDIKKGEKS